MIETDRKGGEKKRKRKRKVKKKRRNGDGERAEKTDLDWNERRGDVRRRTLRNFFPHK